MDTQPGWMLIAEGELGEREIAGVADNPRIVAYHATTRGGPSPDEVPWCSSFVNWVMAQAGLPRTGSKVARSWLQWGVPLVTPRPGCVVVMRRGRGWQGHVGFFVKMEGAYVVVRGGNQGNAVSDARYPVAAVLGYRWPA